MIRRDFNSACLLAVAASLALLPMGCKKAPPITLSANATPPAVFPGEPVTVTATAGSVDPKKNTNVIYNWSGTGASGNSTSTTVQTASLDPGNYSVKAEVKEGMEDLQKKMDAAEQKLKSICTASGEAWEKLKTEVDAAMDSVKDAYQKIAARFE